MLQKKVSLNSCSILDLPLLDIFIFIYLSQIYSSGPGTKLNEQTKLPPYPWKIILLNFCCNLDEHKEQKYLDQLMR